MRDDDRAFTSGAIMPLSASAKTANHWSRSEGVLPVSLPPECLASVLATEAYKAHRRKNRIFQICVSAIK